MSVPPRAVPFDLKAVVRPNIWNLAPYSCARDEFGEEKEVMLDANENAHGACVEEYASDKGAQLKPLRLERYPDPKAAEVKRRLVALRGGSLTEDNIFLGVGSDEAIDLVIRIFCRPEKDKVLQCPPTYGMYKVSAQTNDVGIVNVPLTPDTFQIDEPGVLSAVQADPSIKLVFVCTPNNPTGNLIDEAAVLRVCNAFQGVVVVDEAYVDFTGRDSWCRRIPAIPNLLVLQTFSKSFGLAAARLGMAYAAKPIIDIMNKVKAPYNVNALTAAVACASLENNAAEMHRKVADILAERRRVSAVLPSVPCVRHVYPSDSNYLLVKVTDATWIYQYLASNGVVVRNRTTQPLCSGCLRITVGTRKENDALLRLLRKVPASKL